MIKPATIKDQFIAVFNWFPLIFFVNRICARGGINVIATITEDELSLVSDDSFTELTLSYGKSLDTKYNVSGLNTTTYSISKETLGLTSLLNIYFKIETDFNEIGAYEIEVENKQEALLYNAANLKQDLDDLNFYSGLLENLNNNYNFLEANQVFTNFMNFLQKDLNANSFLQYIGKQD